MFKLRDRATGQRCFLLCLRKAGFEYRRFGDARLRHRNFTSAAAATVVFKVILEVVLAAL
jgi:hypothetical protein